MLSVAFYIEPNAYVCFYSLFQSARERKGWQGNCNVFVFLIEK